MKAKLLKATLFLISAYHLILGFLGFVSADFAARIAQYLFDMNLVLTDQSGYLASLLGAYAFAFGLFFLVAAFDPQKYTHVIYIGIVLYLLRLIHRIVFADVVRDAFNVSDLNRALEIVLLVFFAVALFLLRPGRQRDPD